jgi:hypothetical protein
MNNIHGELVLSTVICFTDVNGTQKAKRVTLASVPCSYSEREKVKADFVEKNNHMRARTIDAHFKYCEFI